LSGWLSRRDTHPSVATNLEAFARERGMLRRGGEIDRRNAARAYLKEFRAGHLGRVTFELAEERD
jgi:ribosome biogenesis GTPase A